MCFVRNVLSDLKFQNWSLGPYRKAVETRLRDEGEIGPEPSEKSVKSVKIESDQAWRTQSVLLRRRLASGLEIGVETANEGWKA